MTNVDDVAKVDADLEEETIDPAEYARLLDLYDRSFRNISEGEVVKGTVLKVSSSEVMVDVGYKSEGIISLTEFFDENGQVTVQPGDTVAAFVFLPRAPPCGGSTPAGVKP